MEKQMRYRLYILTENMIPNIISENTHSESTISECKAQETTFHHELKWLRLKRNGNVSDVTYLL